MIVGFMLLGKVDFGVPSLRRSKKGVGADHRYKTSFLSIIFTGKEKFLFKCTQYPTLKARIFKV